MTTTQARTTAADRLAERGDGSALASFLCPVCFHDALVDDVACSHLLLVQDRHGDVYCRDLRVRRLAREAEAASGGRGPEAIERLCERLGPAVVLYELVERGASGTRGPSVFFVVDATQVVRADGAHLAS